MHSPHSSIVTNFQRALWLGLVAAGLTVLAGCASNQDKVNQASARADLVTESDEPDVRRRARIRLELAVGYFEQGQTNIALDELKQSIATDPTWSEAYNLRGLIYMRLNEQRLAEDSFQRALQISPREGNYLHNYGWLACQQGRYPESLDELVPTYFPVVPLDAKTAGPFVYFPHGVPEDVTYPVGGRDETFVVVRKQVPFLVTNKGMARITSRQMPDGSWQFISDDGKRLELGHSPAGSHLQIWPVEEP